jgi:hypothetical protein
LVMPTSLTETTGALWPGVYDLARFWIASIGPPDTAGTSAVARTIPRSELVPS